MNINSINLRTHAEKISGKTKVKFSFLQHNKNINFDKYFFQQNFYCSIFYNSFYIIGYFSLR